jgi:hypothetical protein
MEAINLLIASVSRRLHEALWRRGVKPATDQTTECNDQNTHNDSTICLSFGTNSLYFDRRWCSRYEHHFELGFESINTSPKEAIQ